MASLTWLTVQPFFLGWIDWHWIPDTDGSTLALWSFAGISREPWLDRLGLDAVSPLAFLVKALAARPARIKR